MKLIDKNKLLEELKKLKQNLSASPIVVIEDVESLVEGLEVKDVDLETDVEREYVKCHIDIFDKKFPIMPTLKGKHLHDYKNFLNTCQQIFGLKRWGMHPTQAKLFEKLSLLWATWGAQHLKGLFEMSPEERQKMDDIKGE